MSEQLRSSCRQQIDGRPCWTISWPELQSPAILDSPNKSYFSWVTAGFRFNEKMLCKFAEGRSNSGRFWKGFKLGKYDDSESSFAAHGITSLDFDPCLNHFK